MWSHRDFLTVGEALEVEKKGIDSDRGPEKNPDLPWLSGSFKHSCEVNRPPTHASIFNFSPTRARGLFWYRSHVASSPPVHFILRLLSPFIHTWLLGKRVRARASHRKTFTWASLQLHTHVYINSSFTMARAREIKSRVFSLGALEFSFWKNFYYRTAGELYRRSRDNPLHEARDHFLSRWSYTQWKSKVHLLRATALKTVRARSFFLCLYAEWSLVDAYATPKSRRQRNSVLEEFIALQFDVDGFSHWTTFLTLYFMHFMRPSRCVDSIYRFLKLYGRLLSVKSAK